MFDRTKFVDIEPFDQKGCEEACVRLKAHPEYIYALASAIYEGIGDEVNAKRMDFTKAVAGRLDRIHSYDDFQKIITSDVFLKTILENSVSEFTWDGTDKLDKDTSYLYVSNHRDIVLDCALMDLALFRSGLPLCEMAIGDNLLSNSFVEDVFRLNGAIIVKRDLPVRDKYLETVRLSEYFVERIASGKSIWVAQKSGRSKDGLDLTHPSIIKMLHLSKKKDGIPFSQVIKDCRIVPVCVSYEYDPNDITKAREEVITQQKGSYEKGRWEDLFSMIRGLREFKGRIHISFGDVLSSDYANADEVAREIDRQIHSSYRLYETNWYCYDRVNGTDENRDKYADMDTDRFMSRYAHLSEAVVSFILNGYANPVRSYLETLRP